MAWTPEREALARKLYIEEGRSAAETARTVGGGVTRNSIIGVAHRRGWLKEARQPAAKPARAPAVPRSHVRPPKPGPQNKPAVILGPYSVASDNQRIERAAEGQAANASVDRGGGVESPNAKQWMERRFGECSWPIGTAGAVLSCCNPIAGGDSWGRSWCQGHVAVGVSPNQPAGPRPRDASRLTRFDGVERDRPTPRPSNDESIWDDARLVA